MTAALSDWGAPQPRRAPKHSGCGSLVGHAGVGLRGAHHAQFIHGSPDVRWLEAHSENYFASDGVARQTLERVRGHYDISLHGVGLSLGSTDPLNIAHLRKLAELIAAIEPCLVSEHLSWSSVNGLYLNDLLPLPYTLEAARHVSERIEATQEFLNRTLLIENVSGYIEFTGSEMTEWEFLTEITRRSGADILLDVNNIYVNAHNHGFDAATYIRSIPRGKVREMHLAGHSEQRFEDTKILVDTHDAAVCREVWQLYETAVQVHGPAPTLIEWDSKLPSVERLLREASRAQGILDAADRQIT